MQGKKIHKNMHGKIYTFWEWDQMTGCCHPRPGGQKIKCIKTKYNTWDRNNQPCPANNMHHSKKIQFLIKPRNLTAAFYRQLVLE